MGVLYPQYLWREKQHYFSNSPLILIIFLYGPMVPVVLDAQSSNVKSSTPRWGGNSLFSHTSCHLWLLGGKIDGLNVVSCHHDVRKSSKDSEDYTCPPCGFHAHEKQVSSPVAAMLKLSAMGGSSCSLHLIT